ncbi:phage holin family protein [Bernardetia sp. ABR2-2B]|uniref:phage holin family protein n=1 Tax=Bernardetia sp. ABR2-2B TaxID=3127472 RepID=UPI0030CFBC69
MNKEQIIKQIKDYFGLNVLSEQIQIYLDFQKEIIKTSVVDGSSKAIHGVIKGAGFAFLGLCIFLFLNLMLGFGISEWFFNSRYWTGFSILTGFYIILAVIFAALQSTIKEKVEDEVIAGIKGTPLELKNIREIIYPKATISKHIEKESIEANTTESNSTQQEIQRTLEEQAHQEMEQLDENKSKDS